VLFDIQAEVVSNRQINPVTFLMGLDVPDIASAANPGQFVMLRVNNGVDPLLRRPFSICGTGDRNILFILYKTVGSGTGVLSEKKLGERLWVMGPLGNGFSLPAPGNKAIMVAGGIGIAPLNFLAGAIKKKPIEFMIGFASSGDIIPNGQITDRDMNISIATDDGSFGYPGMVTELLIECLDRQVHQSDKLLIYACGPMPMLKKTALIAADRNIICWVSLEAMMACGLGACQGCAVKVMQQDKPTPYRHVCKDGPVFPSTDIDWSNV
jgi:dihydroorotate dehydrogenase electron transfer subunit